MADQQTLDSSTQFDDLSHSHSTSDPSLLRSLSSSRLNAEAPEFVPGRTTPPLPQPPMMIIPPPPPPHGVLNMYHQPPFNVLGSVQNHHPHRFHHNRHHNNQQYVPVRNHGHQDYQQREKEHDLVAKKSERRDHKRDSKSETGASVVIDSKTGLPEDTVHKIVNQVEYYFSDLNLATTDHLMKFISKDPEGYVPIHVVSSFKKVKAVVSGNSQLVTVLQNSAKLVVSEDGKKVRRINPITEAAIQELQSRIVIAENLPEDHCYQNLMKIFSTVGSVKNIRTCQPQSTGNGVPPAARSAKSDFSNKVHAFVEYEMVELAEKAVTELNETGNWRSSGLKVRLMLKHQTNEPKQGQGRGGKGHGVEVKHERDDATTSEQQSTEKQPEECSGEWETHVQEQVITGEEQGSEKAVGQRKGRNRGKGKGRGRGQPHQNQNQNHSGVQLHHQNHNHHHKVGTPPSNNPMNSMEQAGMGKQQPPGPRMPDGTRGFSMGRGKPVMVQAD